MSFDRSLHRVRCAVLASFTTLWALAADAQAPATAARVVVDASRAEAPISPLLYGQFLEFMFEGVKRGVTAELLRDRGFDDAPNAIGLPRYWERYPDDRNDDYGLSFGWDDSTYYAASSEHFERPPAQHALRVDAGRGVIGRHGVYQARVPLRAGVAYRGYVWARAADDFRGRLRVALERDADGGPAYAEATLDSVRGDWRRYEFELRPEHADPLARFVILVEGRGRVWLDAASLLPGDAVGGVRADVLARVAALRPAFLRWPGGNVAQDYHWQWGVGPRDRRPTWVNLSWKNEPEPGDFGTAEYVAFARRVGAEPTLTVNVEGRGATPEEAAAWVEYCNGAVTTRWGALRAAHGHPEPFAVRYWEVGNEIWGDWVRGHSDAETYARNLERYARAMRAVDSSIRLVAVGDNDMAWNRTVLRRAGRWVDYLAIHHYYGHDSTQRDLRNLMARPLFFERFYRDVERVARAEVPGRTIRLAINEWGLDVPEAWQHGMVAALYGARLMNVLERSAPLVAMSAVSDLVNGWPGGIVQAGRDTLFVTPLYHAVRLWATHLGAERLGASVTAATFEAPASGAGAAVPWLDATASRAGDRIFVKLVNVDTARALDVRVEVRGVELAPDGELEVLSAEAPGARSSFAAPDAIAPRRRALRVAARTDVRLPAGSVAVLTVRVAR
ncbi:MAG: alpha-L-arabinofuranosidase C-terminal domain-containing protein [Gemmatimonadaceae bacterium]